MSTIKVNRLENTATTDGGIDIDSSGKVGVGTSSPTFAAGGGIHNKGSNGAFTSFRVSVDSNTGVDFAAANDGKGFIYNRDNADLTFGTNNTERLRILSDGKLGLGTSSPREQLHVSGPGDMKIELETTDNDNVGLEFKSSASNFIIQGGNAAGNGLRFYDIGNAGERLRIDSSGNVGIGTTSPSHKLTIDSTSDADLFFIRSTANANNTSLRFGISGNDCEIHGSGGSSGNLAFKTFGNERMRITSGGEMLFRCTGITGDAPNATGARVYQNNGNCKVRGTSTTSSGSDTAFQFYHGTQTSAPQGRITIDNSSVSYHTSSDYRLKENVVDIADGITRIKQLAPKRFNFIVDAEKTVDGFLAHEAQTVVPEAVSGTHNEVDADGTAVMQGIDQSKLVPLLTAALQEAIAKIETLEARVTTLEAG